MVEPSCPQTMQRQRARVRAAAKARSAQRHSQSLRRERRQHKPYGTGCVQLPVRRACPLASSWGQGFTVPIPPCSRTVQKLPRDDPSRQVQGYKATRPNPHETLIRHTWTLHCTTAPILHTPRHVQLRSEKQDRQDSAACVRTTQRHTTPTPHSTTPTQPTTTHMVWDVVE